MNVTQLFDRIAGKQRERQHSREMDFRKLVTEIADGTDPDPNTVDQILSDSHKSLEDLQQAVELLLRRRELRATLDKAKRLAKDRGRIAKQIAAADKLLEQAETQHEDTTAPLYARIEAIKQADVDAERARRDLWETCAYPELIDSLADVLEQYRKLHGQLNDLKMRAADRRRFAEGDRDEQRFAQNKAADMELSQRADRHDQTAIKLEAEAEPFLPQLAELEKEERRLREQMLKP
jgi:hypothetical protein